MKEKEGEFREVVENFESIERECAAARQSVGAALREKMLRLREDWAQLRDAAGPEDPRESPARVSLRAVGAAADEPVELRENSARVDSPRAGSPRDVTLREASARADDDSARDRPARDDSARDSSPRDAPVRDSSVGEVPVRDGSARARSSEGSRKSSADSEHSGECPAGERWWEAGGGRQGVT